MSQNGYDAIIVYKNVYDFVFIYVFVGLILGSDIFVYWSSLPL